MDYLQEVERRQRATLTRLLTGGRSGEETAAEEEQRRTAVRPGTETGRTETVRPAGGQTATAERREVMIPEATEQRTALQETQEEPVRLDSKEALSEQEAAFFQARQADAMWRNANIPAASLPGILLADREAAVEIERISRAVQRDARRYDGGFTIF